MPAHNLNVECGRYQYRNIEWPNRICTLCELNDIKVELHFIHKSPYY